MSVGGDPEATPRQRLAHAAYAMRAERAGSADMAANADKLDGQDSAAFAAASHTHSGADLTNGSVTAAKLAAGVVPKFFSLDPYAAFLPTAAYFDDGYGPFSGIHFPDTSNGSFSLGFTIPPNYSAGTTLVVRTVWHTAAVNCGIRFRGNSISVARVGRTHIIGGGASTGLTVVGGETLTAPGTSNQSNETLINIDAPVAGEKLLPGDSIIFSLFRSPTEAADTCTADMVIQSFSVIYQ